MTRIFVDVEDDMVTGAWTESGEQVEVIVVSPTTKELFEIMKKDFHNISNYDLVDGFGRAGAQDVWVYNVKSRTIDARYRHDVMKIYDEAKEENCYEVVSRATITKTQDGWRVEPTHSELPQEDDPSKES